MHYRGAHASGRQRRGPRLRAHSRARPRWRHRAGREALRRLSAEGLVYFHPNRGFWAAEVGLDAVLRRLEVRLILEPGIARLAAARRSDRHLAELHRSIAREDKAR